MKDLYDMSPSELRAFADELEDKCGLVKRGILKHDLYYRPSCQELNCGYTLDHYITEHEKNALIEEISGCFNRVLRKGDRFVAYQYNGNISWYDDVGYGLEDLSEEWAEKHLEIEEVHNETK